MITKKVQVTVTVEVTVDEQKFTSEFMQQFRDYFYPFDSVDDHIRHLGQMYARGLYVTGNFIEGYGPQRRWVFRLHREKQGLMWRLWNDHARH